MGWTEVSVMSARREFVRLARQEGANVRELCRRYEISPTTAYKWIERGHIEEETYADRSRKPHLSPNQTSQALETLVLAMRDEHPFWNARKIRRLLQNKLGTEARVPAASTIGCILRRNGRISEEASEAAQPWQRFEHAAPNDLSQIDFKGNFETGQGRCYGLTMIDDHSRYAQILKACTNERGDTVKTHLIEAFRRYGLPKRINADNGNPWGNPSGEPYTKLTVWLMRLAIRISHSRPYHPQTNGKDERFHRTLGAELLNQQWFETMAEVQSAFDKWKEVYNQERPHEALGLEVPATKYRASARSYPETLPPIEYGGSDLVRTVRPHGAVRLWGHDVYLSTAFAGQPIALRHAAEDGTWNVFFCHEQIATVNRRDLLVTLTRAGR